MIYGRIAGALQRDGGRDFLRGGRFGGLQRSVRGCFRLGDRIFNRAGQDDLRAVCQRFQVDIRAAFRAGGDQIGRY